MDEHYVITVDVKYVARREGLAGKVERDVTDLLHLARTADDLPAAVAYAGHVLAELIPTRYAVEGSDQARLEKAINLFEPVRRQVFDGAGRGVSSTDVDDLTCRILQITTGASLSVEDGRVVGR